MLGDSKFLIYSKRYPPKPNITMLWHYSVKALSKQLNHIKVGDDGIMPMETCRRKTTDITLKHQNTRGCPVFILKARDQN